VKNVFILSILNDYYVDISKKLQDIGLSISIINVSLDACYESVAVDDFISNSNVNIIISEDYNQTTRFEKIFDPDYSFLTSDTLSRLAYYEKLFLMSTDRLSFYPTSHIDRSRLFYRYIAHFYKLINVNKVDVIVNFGIPHGLYAIAIFGLAKIMGIKTVYFDWIYIAAELSLVETDININRNYAGREIELGKLIDISGMELVYNAIEVGKHNKMPVIVDNGNKILKTPKRKNKLMVFVKKILSLIFKKPCMIFLEPSFYLEKRPKARVQYALPLVKYFYTLNKIIRFYDNNSAEVLPTKNDIVLFLHFQPEASSMPAGGIFSDQLLVYDLLLQALPDGVDLYIKEHPMMFEVDEHLYQQRHERSVEFYKHLISDQRVKLVSREVSSADLIKHASVVASICGSISWEAMVSGTPSINFGWAWFVDCRSCYQVDSVDSINCAIKDAFTKTKEEVLSEVDVFLRRLKKRAIYGASSHFALPYVASEYSYNRGVNNIAQAIKMSSVS